jgi:hypothetical protein
VRLLVQVTEGHSVGEELIELCGHFQPHLSSNSRGSKWLTVPYA